MLQKRTENSLNVPNTQVALCKNTSKKVDENPFILDQIKTHLQVGLIGEYSESEIQN